MSKPETLHLTLKRQFFDEIVRRVKNKEYRQYKPYWKTRLEDRKYDVVKFRNGYGRNAPEMVVEFRGLIRNGTSRNADYVIKLGRIFKLKRWPPKGQ
jgi:hypothetical protein